MQNIDRLRKYVAASNARFPFHSPAFPNSKKVEDKHNKQKRNREVVRRGNGRGTESQVGLPFEGAEWEAHSLRTEDTTALFFP
jgi:hypothetical protein